MREPIRRRPKRWWLGELTRIANGPKAWNLRHWRSRRLSREGGKALVEDGSLNDKRAKVNEVSSPVRGEPDDVVAAQGLLLSPTMAH